MVTKEKQSSSLLKVSVGDISETNRWKWFPNDHTAVYENVFLGVESKWGVLETKSQKHLYLYTDERESEQV